MTDLKYTMTDRMRDAIANSDWMDVGRVDPETIALGYEYFDLWLNAQLADAWDEGHWAGGENVARRMWEDGDDLQNPYRKADS